MGAAQADSGMDECDSYLRWLPQMTTGERYGDIRAISALSIVHKKQELDERPLWSCVYKAEHEERTISRWWRWAEPVV